jgi:cytochrome c
MKYRFSSALAIALLGLLVSGAATASEKIAIRAGCATCHAATKKVIGPAYRDIAIKYKGKPNAVAMLSERIRKGGKGVWGEIPMAPTPAERLNDADLKAVLTWVLQTPP